MGDGITWLDIVMAVLTVLGFIATGYGLYQAWDQARNAASAAEKARAAVSDTRAQLATFDLLNELRSTRKSIADVEGARDRNEAEAAKFTLVQLADSMRRAATLVRDGGTPISDQALVSTLDTLSREASSAKAELARRTTMKVRTATESLFPQLTELSHLLLEIETTQQYTLTEDR